MVRAALCLPGREMARDCSKPTNPSDHNEVGVVGLNFRAPPHPWGAPKAASVQGLIPVSAAGCPG